MMDENPSTNTKKKLAQQNPTFLIGFFSSFLIFLMQKI